MFFERAMVFEAVNISLSSGIYSLKDYAAPLISRSLSPWFVWYNYTLVVVIEGEQLC